MLERLATSGTGASAGVTTCISLSSDSGDLVVEARAPGGQVGGQGGGEAEGEAEADVRASDKARAAAAAGCP